MIHRTGILVALLACSSLVSFNTVFFNSAYASQNGTDEIQQQAQGKISGKVTDMLESAGYTYAEVDTGSNKVWAAAASTPLKIGDSVTFTTEMPMKNFHSNSMNRDFPIIYFVSNFNTGNASSTGMSTDKASPHGVVKPAAVAKLIEGIEKVEGGSTIAEVYSNKQELSGKAVRVRGQVTKFTANVMGKNWLHIRDSSTLDDLTITTDNASAIDAIVVIEGKLTLDKDYGYGYSYPLIVEDASVVKE